MSYTFCEIAESNDLKLHAAKILMNAFKEIGSDSWKDMKSSIETVEECIKEPNICIGICDIKNNLCGWIGLRPMYEKTWEMHPLVVKTDFQRKGIGTRLLCEIERIAKEKGIIGIALGADDENGRTSLSSVEIDKNNIFREIESIKNIKNHPFEFYKKCGYFIVGIIPNANGEKKPDIWMWKKI